MKKIILSTFLILTGFFTLSAQNDVLPNLMAKGTNMGSLGVGLPVIGAGYRMTVPPIAAFYEVGILDLGRPGSVAVGAHAGFWGYRYKASIGDYDATYRYFNTLVGLRGTYHFTHSGKLGSIRRRRSGIETGIKSSQRQYGYYRITYPC